TTEKGPSRCGGLSAVQREPCVGRNNRKRAFRQTRFFRRGLSQQCEQALSHLGVAGVDAHGFVRTDFKHRLAVFGKPVADADVFYAACDAGVSRSSVDLLDRFQSLLEPDARFERLAGAEAVPDVEGVSISDLPSVDAYTFGQNVEH